MRRTQEGYSPFKDDKPKDTENSPFEASSVLVVKANIQFFVVLNKVQKYFLVYILIIAHCFFGVNSKTVKRMFDFGHCSDKKCFSPPIIQITVKNSSELYSF